MNRPRFGALAGKSRYVFFLLALVPLFFLLQNFPRSRSAVVTGPLAPAVAAAPEDEHSFRILLGLNDNESVKWDGSLSVSAGELVKVEPWRFDLDDKFIETTATSARWQISTHAARAFGSANPANPAVRQPVVANGVIATFRKLTAAAEVTVETAPGKFQFRPAEIAYGKPVKLLAGRAMVDRTPASTNIAGARDDEDYPAAATDRAGNVWVAYVQFTPNPKFKNIRWFARTPQPNVDFNELAEPTGGDQVWLKRYARGVWSEPLAISEARGDVYKPAVAVDGTGRVWVFWSGNVNGNFELFARPVVNDKPGAALRLTTERGPDIVPVAATDAKGNVWAAWQAFRNNRFRIHAVRQQGDKFSAEIAVSSSNANEWNPAIAAASNGAVTVAWDSYRKGDYDIYLRTFDGAGKPGAERGAVTTARYEATPSLAYDSAGRLWLAWEETDTGWGKDFGADETSGIGLYHGRWLRLKVWQGERALTPPDVGAVLPGAGRVRVDAPSRQHDQQQGAQPNTDLAKNRRPNQTPAAPQRPKNSYPRLLADPSGRVWLAYRAPHPTWWSGLGTVWFEYVTNFDGATWAEPTFINHSDNILDNRPALASTAAGELFIIGSSDGRQQFNQEVAQYRPIDDPYNNNLYAARLVSNDALKPVQLAEAPAEAAATGVAEDPHARRLRDYRLKVGSTEYRILRGEFHRHTEVSMDGGNDGSQWDAWRYSLDAAALDWLGCCDHDNGHGREYSWWTQQKLTDVFLLPGAFTTMFHYERSVQYPEGHRNVILAQRGVRTLPRLPKVDENATGATPDTQLLYRYLKHFNGIVASHTSGTNMGTDWRDNDPLSEPVVEIYQGDRQNYEMPDAPRSNRAGDSIGGWREKGFVSLALQKGYKLAFQASSDHISTHMSYCNLLVTQPTRQGVLEAFQKRRVYAATDDILADVRSGPHLMGEIFDSSEVPRLSVKLTGTAPFAKVHIIKDNKYVYTIEPKTATVNFTWRDEKAEAGKQSYYYVRGEQQDGEIVWASPMWITYRGR